MFKISHESFSCTMTPGFFPIEKPTEDEDGEVYGTYLVDGAGFNDTNLSREAPNQAAIQYVIENA